MKSFSVFEPCLSKLNTKYLRLSKIFCLKGASRLKKNTPPKQPNNDVLENTTHNKMSNIRETSGQKSCEKCIYAFRYLRERPKKIYIYVYVYIYIYIYVCVCLCLCFYFFLSLFFSIQRARRTLKQNLARFKYTQVFN